MTATTVVVQSHTSPLPAAWYERCAASVRTWSEARGFDYRWLTDELFERLPQPLRQKTRAQPVIASDLARLIVLQEMLEADYERAIWVDADVLVRDTMTLQLPDTDALFGRELWVQASATGQLKVYRKIHNAFMAFTAMDPVLPFYRMSAERILSRYDADATPMVAQLIGPKLLTLLHNAIGFDVLETAGVLSPQVIRDLLGNGGGRALNRYLAESAGMPLALNLCGSTVRGGELTNDEMSAVVDRLLAGDFPGA
jgi:hypothetical protein